MNKFASIFMGESVNDFSPNSDHLCEYELRICTVFHTIQSPKKHRKLVRTTQGWNSSIKPCFGAKFFVAYRVEVLKQKRNSGESQIFSKLHFGIQNCPRYPILPVIFRIFFIPSLDLLFSRLVSITSVNSSKLNTCFRQIDAFLSALWHRLQMRTY